MLLIPYHSNNKKTVYISKPLVNFKGMSTFLYLGSSQIVNDTPLPKKTKKINPLNAISDAQF